MTTTQPIDQLQNEIRIEIIESQKVRANVSYVIAEMNRHYIQDVYTMTEKFTTVKDRRTWADKMLYKHNELYASATRRLKRHTDIV